MNLGELIDRLKKEDLDREIPIGFHCPHSYCKTFGDYSTLAFEITFNTDIRHVLEAAEYAERREFEGRNGVLYFIDLKTPVYLVREKFVSGIEMTHDLMSRLLMPNNKLKDESVSIKTTDEIIEACAAAVHVAYCNNYLERTGESYWTNGNYELLDDETKEIDRVTVRTVLETILKEKSSLNRASKDFANYLVGHCKNIKSEYVKIVEENFLDLLA